LCYISRINEQEFKGEFDTYLYDNNILHKVSEVGRHQQNANAENLNRTLGRLFNGYMNQKEEETGHVYREWDDIIDIVRKDLNKIRKIPERDIYTFKYDVPNMAVQPKYKVGDIVYRRSDIPLNALGKKQPTQFFREGDYRYDRVPRKIIKVLIYPGKVNIRYVLNELKHVSYAETELLPALEKEEEFTVKEIIDKKVVNRKTYYKVWWKGYPKAEATWEAKTELMIDVPHLIKEYEDKHK
jgi:hypothetical protein